jgi:hypothetical protein
MSTIETVQRFEPARLEDPGQAIGDVVAELSAASATLARALQPKTAANLAALVRVINAYQKPHRRAQRAPQRCRARVSR